MNESEVNVFPDIKCERKVAGNWGKQKKDLLGWEEYESIIILALFIDRG